MENNSVKNTQKIPRYLTVKQLSQLYPAFSELSLRFILFHRHKNKADSFVIKVGKRKLIIDVEKFEIWLKQQQEV